MQKFFTKRNLSLAVFLMALISMLGSLYYSEIEGLEPCILCWYQRIAMYPIVAISAVGLLRRDVNIPFYILPLSIIGGGIAIYHYAIQQLSKVQIDLFAPCSPTGVSCTIEYISYFGFVTIPLMSGVAFIVITVLSILTLRAKE